MNLPKGFTLIELLIVVGVMAILTAAALPSFGSFANRRIFQNNVDLFAENIRSARSKALSGVAVSGKNVSWKITPDNGLNTYKIGYIVTSDFTEGTTSTETLAGTESTFSCGSVPANACKVVFERLTGKRTSGTTGSSQDITVVLSETADSRTIKIYESGKIVVANP